MLNSITCDTNVSKLISEFVISGFLLEKAIMSAIFLSTAFPHLPYFWGRRTFV